MVLNKKQTEKPKKIMGKKQKKLSRSGDQYTEPPTEQIPEDRGSVSMESMVTLRSEKLRKQFVTVIHLLKFEKYIDAVEGLKSIIKAVMEEPSYGVYGISTRTENKRTTLSALNMFTALAYEGLARPKKAIEYCNNAIAEDPGWPIPFTKRSEYFACLEQYFLQTCGAGKEEIIRARITADIIVDQSHIPGEEDTPINTFRDLQEALNAASEGDKIFIEEGTYYREDGFNIHRRCSLLGASSMDCILISRGSPTIQIFGGGGKGKEQIIIQRIQFQNQLVKQTYEENDTDSMSSNSAHMYVISPETILIRDCLFVGGADTTGGILVAEEAFYQSLLDLELENPEFLGTASEISEKVLNLNIDFCIFSGCGKNSALFSNNQAVTLISNSWLYNCGQTGLQADEGSVLTVFNCQISDCSFDCIKADNVSSVNVCGSLISNSGTCLGPKEKKHYAGLTLIGKSKANVSKSLMKNHLSAVSVDDSDLVFEENCVMDISNDADGEAFTDQGLQLEHSAIFIRRGGNIGILKNNFHNCNLVWLIQQGASPRIVGNAIETCLIGFICGSRSVPRIESNMFHCILMSIGMFIEDSTGCLVDNKFHYVSNGLDIHRGSAPLLSRNAYTALVLPGLQTSLAFDIVKVNSGKVADMEDKDIITICQNTDEKSMANLILRRKACCEKMRNCSNCGNRKICVFTCDKCDQISYCSEECRIHDRTRHKMFCSLTLSDLL